VQKLKGVSKPLCEKRFWVLPCRLYETCILLTEACKCVGWFCGKVKKQNYRHSVRIIFAFHLLKYFHLVRSSWNGGTTFRST